MHAKSGATVILSVMPRNVPTRDAGWKVSCQLWSNNTCRVSLFEALAGVVLLTVSLVHGRLSWMIPSSDVQFCLPNPVLIYWVREKHVS